MIIETHGCLDTHCVSLKLESTLPVWSYPSRPALSLPPNHLLRSSLILSSLPLFLFFSVSVSPTTVKRIQRVVENSCAGKHCLVVSVRISKNSRCFVETLFPAKNSSTTLCYDFPPSPLPCLFAIAVRANVSSNDSRGSILDEPLLFPNLYSPVKCFRKQFSNFSLAFYNHSLFHQFPLIPFFEKKRKEGRKNSPIFSSLRLLAHLENYGTLRWYFSRGSAPCNALNSRDNGVQLCDLSVDGIGGRFHKI